MSEESVYQSSERKSRQEIASYLHRVADKLADGGPVPVDEDESVTVDPPADPRFEIDIEREDGNLNLELEIEWAEAEGSVVTEAAAGSDATFELFQDKAGEYRWRLRHRNGNIIADSGEGYTSKQKAKQGLESVRKNAPGAVVEEQD